MKVWTIKTNECVATLDQHTEKVKRGDMIELYIYTMSFCP